MKDDTASMRAPGQSHSSMLHPSMRVRTASQYDRKVREIENAWIELSDGCKLAARIWLPEDAESSPVPAVLEYLPYRKRDGTAERDSLMHPYLAGHGYAGVRVDMRGSGESDGLLRDEYLKQEQDDALEVIAWLARQSWCTGAVGMIGISWGGFNGLQIAARRPPALKAIITACSTDDRYADDTHYIGGAVLGANLTWASTMVANQTRPPDKALVGERWREMWIERLRTMPLFVALWLEHQRRDEYWRHGSVCEDFSSIQCPVYAVGGWDDSYTNAIPRMLAGLKVPKKGLIGPWAHRYPHFGLPGPQIGFLQESLRWWDKWLKGVETGIMDEPMMRAWLQDSVRPAPWYAERPGRWVAESTWPSGGVKKYLTETGISERPGPEQPMVLASPETVGALSGMWCPHGLTPDDPPDQREEDAKSLLFDTAPLGERVEILGAPVIELDLSSDRANAKLVIRLCDVHPDGASTRVCYGILNLTHRDGHAAPAPLEPGRRYRVRLQLNDVGYAFPPGNRIRIALSSTYWPLTWPSPERVTLTLYGGTASITLPVRSAAPDDADLLPLAPAEVSPPEARTVLRKGDNLRRITRDVGSGRTVFLLRDDDGRVRIDSHGLEIGSVREHEYSINDEDPLSACAETRWTKEIGRGDWQTRAVTRTVMTSTKDEFIVRAELDAFENEERVYSNNWERRIKRDLV
jgi:putative CocE/NonD family hydrolase